ncbi:MAG: hypothetical protein H6682_18085 [Candidatus Eisenbacteria bacterium]|nr:hypothetical protein [Candidatus Eisenbacteria bacterium]
MLRLPRTNTSPRTNSSTEMEPATTATTSTSARSRCARIERGAVVGTLRLDVLGLVTPVLGAFALGLLGLGLLGLVTPSAHAANPASSVGLGHGTVGSYQGEGGCGDLMMNGDGTYENGYTWQYGGVVPPYFGAFAECYPAVAPVCAVVLDLTQTGTQFGHLMDVYVWDDDNESPGAVSCVITNVDPGPVAFWPSLSRHVIEVPNCGAGSRVWVGYWGTWVDEINGWWIGADLDGYGGCPRSNIAPGIGYPTGWQNVSVVWGPTQSIGIGAMFGDGSIQGACCYPDGSCLVLSFTECDGSFIGTDTTCDPNPCPQAGICCLPDGSCILEYDDVCDSMAGQWFEGDSCAPNPCPEPEPGACCYPGGYCALVTVFGCEGGVYQGDGTACEPNPCVEGTFGACCYTDSGCVLRAEEDCTGDYLGDGTSCDPNPCPPLVQGACCFRDGTCQQLAEFECVIESGQFFTDEVCDPNPCVQPVAGACCLDDGSCVSSDQTSCAVAEGTFQGEGTACEPNPCPTPVPGACCLALGTCEFSDDVTCGALGGVFQGAESSCEPNPCPEPCVPFALNGRASATAPPPSSDPFGSNASRDGDGPNRGGTLVLHAESVLVLSEDPGAATCNLGTVPQCDDVVARADVETPIVIHALAMFPEAASPRLVGIAFGVDFPVCVELLDWQTCADFEIAEGSWPAPGSGTALAWSSAQTDLVVPVYAFEVQGFSAEPGEFGLIPHPTQGALFADDSVPSILDDIAGLGSFGFFRDGVTPCPTAQTPTGACCFSDGICEVLTFASCEEAGGVFIGVDVPCHPTPCPDGVSGACCFPSTGQCLQLNAYGCAAGGGTYLGDGSECEPNPCPENTSGACCFGDGSCHVVPRLDCVDADGLYVGDGTPCDPDPCPPAGACCLDSGTCAFIFQSYCTSLGGEFQGDGVDCEPGLCPLPGACCFPIGLCTIDVPSSCEDAGGTFQGPETTCEPNPCPQPADGACCFPNGSCQFVNMFECDALGGTYFGDGIACDTNPCPQPPDGACCFIDGTCLFVDAFECDDLDGNYLGNDIPCDPNPCPQPEIGACCLPDGGCEVLADYECEDVDGAFLGDGSVCDGALCGLPCTPPLTPPYSPEQGTRGPNANGALVLHSDPGVEYTFDQDSYCGATTLLTCGDAQVSTDRNFESVVMHVFAAFPRVASPRVAGVTFGVSYAECFVLQGWGSCGDFELANADWPAAGEGTAVTWGSAQSGETVEVYWFAGYVYSFDSTTFDLIPHPTQGAFFADDDVPPNLDPIAALGRFGFGESGLLPCPYDGSPGACCLADGSCEVLFPEDCNASGGSYQGDGTVCDPNPCSGGVGSGACCLQDGSCLVLIWDDCVAFGGDYQGDDTICDPNPCPQPVGACCHEFTCTILTEIDCEASDGFYVGDGTDCDPNPCYPVPTIESSWGRVKETFRELLRRK